MLTAINRGFTSDQLQANPYITAADAVWLIACTYTMMRGTVLFSGMVDPGTSLNTTAQDLNRLYFDLYYVRLCTFSYWNLAFTVI